MGGSRGIIGLVVGVIVVIILIILLMQLLQENRHRFLRSPAAGYEPLCAGAAAGAA